MSNLFKGYAQKSDFSGNLLKGEDPSDKILEEGKRYLSQWKDVSQGEREDQQRYLAALEAKYQAEDADRKRNQKLESYFVDGWEQALHTRHQQLVKNAQDKLTASQKTAQKLQGWSEKAGQIGIQKAEQYAEKQREFGSNLAIDLGLSWEQAKGIQAAEGVFNDQYKGTNSAILEARKAGASWEQINQIHKLNFLGKQGFRVGHAQSIGENYRNNIIQKHGDKYETSFGEYSLAEATAMGNVELTQVILRKMRTAYLNENSDVSNKLLAKYSREAIIRAEGRVISTVREKNAKEEQRGVELEQSNTTLTKLKDGTLLDHVYNQFGTDNSNRAGAWSLTHNHLLSAANDGRANAAHIESWLRTKIPTDDGGEISLEDKFPKRATDLRTAVANFGYKEIQAEQFQLKQRTHKLKLDTFNFRNELLSREEPLESGRLASMIAEADRLYGPENDMSKMLVTFVTDHQAAANDLIYEPQLEKLKAQGMVTTSIVNSMMLSPEKRTAWLKVAKEQDKTQPNEAELKILEDHVDGKISEILKSYGFKPEEVSSADLAAYVGKGRIKKYFTTWAQDPNLSRGDVLVKALERFETDIKNDYKITTTGHNDTYRPHFGTFTVGAKRHPIPLSEFTSQEFAANPKLPYQKLLLDPVPVVKFFDDVSQGRNVGFPTDVSHYVSKFGIGPNGEVKMTELMFLEAQMKLINPDFEIPPQLLQTHKVAFNQIKPEYQKYIVGAHQSTNGIAVALKYSGFENEATQTSNNFADRNTQAYFNMFRNPANMHFYMNLDPEGDADKLDWTEMLVGGHYGQ